MNPAAFHSIPVPKSGTAKLEAFGPPEGHNEGNPGVPVSHVYAVIDPESPPGVGSITLYFQLDDAERDVMLRDRDALVRLKILGSILPPVSLKINRVDEE